MIKHLPLLVVSVAVLNSCVSKKKHAELQAAYDRLKLEQPVQEASILQTSKSAADFEEIIHALQAVNTEYKRVIDKYQALTQSGELTMPEHQETKRYIDEHQDEWRESERERARQAAVTEAKAAYMESQAALYNLEARLSAALNEYDTKEVEVAKPNGQIVLNLASVMLFELGKPSLSASGVSLVNKLGVALAAEELPSYDLVYVSANEDKKSQELQAASLLSLQEGLGNTNNKLTTPEYRAMMRCQDSAIKTKVGCERVALIFHHDYKTVIQQIERMLD